MILNKMNRKYIAGALFLSAAFLVSAREEPVADFDNEYSYENTTYSDEDIVLPGLTTTVSGESITAGRDAVPDFSSVVHSLPNDSTLLPKLPDGSAAVSEDVPAGTFTDNTERNIYAQGLIGGGYPGYFLGDFSVYKSSGEDPFLLQFSHVSANGYGQHSADSGYFDSLTKLLGEKTFTLKSLESRSEVSYVKQDYGLQGLCAPSFYNMTCQTIGGCEKLFWHLPYGFEISGGTGVQWYKRYAGVLPSDTVTYEDYQKGSHAFSFDPELAFKWSNTSFSALLDAHYDLEGLTVDTAKTYVNRGQFDAGFGWKNDSLAIDANAGVVVTQADDGSTMVLPPFSLAFSGEWRVGPALRLFSVSASGGLKSELQRTSELEKEMYFTVTNVIPRETSDWFGSLSAGIPVLSSFQFDVAANLKVTAFGNGVWEADYSSPCSAIKLYGIKETERTQFDTNLAFSYAWKLYTAQVFWKSYWGSYVPALEVPFTVGAVFGAQSESGVWGANFVYNQPLGSGVDMVPVFSLEAFYRVLDSLRLTFQLSDAVKLFSGKDRTYASSAYLSRAGSATVLVRFFF